MDQTLKKARLGLSLALILAFGVSASQAPAGPAPLVSPQEPAAASSTADEDDDKKSEESKEEEKKKKEKEKPFEEVVKDMERIEGLFTFYRNPDENKVLIELLPEQFGRDYLYSSKVERATGEKGLYGTIMRNEFVFQWRRFGNRVQFVEKNTRFRAEPSSPVTRAIENSFTDSLHSSAKVLSKPHPERDSVLVDVNDLLVAQDLLGMAQGLKSRYETPYKLNKSDSGIVYLKSFPRNSEIGVIANFRANETKSRSVTVPDQRSISLQFRYSLVQLPENDYMPRLADDRVGYFMDMYLDYTSDRPDDPYVRYISRWNLVKRNPDAEISEPVEPIVFWLENSIPHEYREWIKEGILLWNPAFEKAGFRNALVVKQQPEDAEWDPADIRYNTIRWMIGYDASFAIGPSHSNPYTGQKIDADIGISEGIMRLGGRRRYELWVHPVQALEHASVADDLAREVGPEGLALGCDYGEGLVERASMAMDLMAARPDWDEATEREFVRQFTMELLAHEVGHTLGLRHNFRGSTVNRPDQLADTDRTRQVGLSGSVMDYNPPIVALKGERQGDYFNTVVGSYDTWAIEYGYKPIPGADTPEAEWPELRKIASRGADSHHPFATDEDAGRNARALDPRVSRYDFSSNPLDFFTHEIRLVNELWGSMEEKLQRPGESFSVLRRAFNRSFNPFSAGAHAAMKYIGGIYHHRDHAGDPGGRQPFVPVPGEEQRRALRFLAETIWAPDAFTVPEGLLKKLQFERLPDFEGRAYRAPRIDYPLHDMAFEAQGEVLTDLYHPLKLSRIADLELSYTPGEEFTLHDLFTGIRDALWSELDQNVEINSFRRNLQREHLRQLSKLVLQPAEGTPGDAVALARADLLELKQRLETAMPAYEGVTRAHLAESLNRVNQVLEAGVEHDLFPKKSAS